MSDYWKISIEEILSEHGVVVTENQLRLIAEDIKGVAEVQGDYSASTGKKAAVISRNESSNFYRRVFDTVIPKPTVRSELDMIERSRSATLHSLLEEIVKEKGR